MIQQTPRCKQFSLTRRPTEADVSACMSDPNNCRRCYGNGYVASSDDHDPWLIWLALPPVSDMAVVLGLITPLTCFSCLGTGKADADE